MKEDMDAVVAEATKFIAACYGFPAETTMTALILKVCTSKMGNKAQHITKITVTATNI